VTRSHATVLVRLLLAALAMTPLTPLIGARADAQRTPSPGSLDSALAAYTRAPSDLDAILWYGRFIGYSGDFQRAVDLYSEALGARPNESWLLRHRGHRYISLRDFDRAIADLTRARELEAGKPDQVEPDGQPNARGIPTSTLHSNIRYHLALAHWLRGEFALAAALWEEDAKLASNLDQRVASTYWWVVCEAQLGRTDRVLEALAPIRADWDILENGSYHRLLLYYRGDVSVDSLLTPRSTPLELQTIGNGIVQWRLVRGERREAELMIRRVLASGPSASFGYLAVEATAQRLGMGQR
jgi:tetratricopeptide (TPR) repeat protein